MQTDQSGEQTQGCRHHNNTGWGKFSAESDLPVSALTQPFGYFAKLTIDSFFEGKDQFR